MHISEVFRQNQPAISFEFFPPKSEAASEALFHTIETLIPLKPAYVSVTYGAGGSTRELTNDLVVKLHHETNLTIVSHLTCVGSSREEIFRILQRYDEHGVQNIMALRGDPPNQELSTRPSRAFATPWNWSPLSKNIFPTWESG